MKKILVFLLVVAVSAVAFAADVPSRETPLLLTGSGDGSTVSSTNPLPVSATGTVSVAIGSISSLKQTAVIATSTAANLTSLSGRTQIVVFNVGTETAWLSFDSTTASATTAAPSIPVYAGGYVTDDLPAALTLGYIASTPVSLTIVEEVR